MFEDLYALYRLFSVRSRLELENSQSEQIIFHELPSNAPGTLMHLLENASLDDNSGSPFGEADECITHQVLLLLRQKLGYF